jgi:hypothetical protein
LRFVYLGHQGFWFDEGNTVLLVHYSPGKLLGLIPQTESTPPLYYCIAWIWARLFGYGEVGLRSLSALAGTLVVPVAYAAGAKLISRRAGLIGAALAAFNPLLIWYSQEARSYELLTLLCSVSLLTFAYVRRDPTPRAVAAWVIASALALATHYYAFLVVVPEAVYLLWIHRRRRSVQIGFVLVGLCGIGLMQLALSQNATGRATWISTSPLGERIGPMFPQFLVGFAFPGYAVLEPIALAIAIGALVLLVARSDPTERRGGVLAAALATSGLVINLILIAAGIDDLLARNALAIWLPSALAVAGGLAAARARLLGLAGAVVLCAIGLYGAIAVDVDRGLQRPDWRVVAAALGPHRGAGRAILIQHYKFLLPLSLYVPRMRGMTRTGTRVSELDVVSFTSPPSNGFCWWGPACNLWPSVMQPDYPIRGFRIRSRTRANQFTILRLVSSHPVRLTPHAVARALRTTRFADDELLVQR